MSGFVVSARTLIHLGAELISSDEVALNELIKNAFDADSPRVSIDFHIPVAHGVVQKALARIEAAETDDEVDDDEDDEPEYLDDAIEGVADELEGAMVSGLPSAEAERVEGQRAALRASEDKDEARRAIESLNEIVVTDSGTGMTLSALRSVFLTIGTPSKLGHSHSPKDRRVLGNKGIGRLAMMRLGARADIVSWTEGAKQAGMISFDWRVFDTPERSIESIPVDIHPVTKRGDSDSGTRITITALRAFWNEQRIREDFVELFVRRLQNPFATEKGGARFPIDVTVNGGHRIPIEGMKKVLSQHAQADMELVFDPAKVKSMEDEILRTELVDHERGGLPDKVQRSAGEVEKALDLPLDTLRSLGPFAARIRWFNRATLVEKTRLLGTLNEARKELNKWSGGVAIYRDGFRVGFTGAHMGEDWLGLDKEALRQSGYMVNRIQVVGALEISHDDNPKLSDRSNREGLIDTPEADAVRKVLNKFAIGALRDYLGTQSDVDKREKLAAVAESAPDNIHTSIESVERAMTDIRPKLPADCAKTMKSITENLQFIRTEVRGFEKAMHETLKGREDILELAGVGSVMGGVLHELTRSTAQTRQLLGKLAKSEDKKTKELLEKLESEIKAINTRLRQLDPLQPSGRHHKEPFNITALVETILSGYQARFERHEIVALLTVDDEAQRKPVMVKMVKGFLSLAVENLLTNAVYWVQQSQMVGETEKRILIDIDSKARVLTLRDNGPGIAESDRQRVFTAGFSLRPRGHGLGLFLAREVATYHGATLMLDTADDDGRYRTFTLELPKDAP
jgi:signal transduction histidine kinase